MTTEYLNQLKIHMLYANESAELTDQRVQEYVDKFNTLNKYDHMEIYYSWEIDGFDKSLELLDKYANIK